MFDKEKISKLKKEVLIVNNAQGAIMDTRAVVDACNSGHIAGLLALLNQYNDIAALQVRTKSGRVDSSTRSSWHICHNEGMQFSLKLLQ
ncbi:Formate dehydrogenase, mitochondrial [Capsicum baccatum]|uniref:Formate dehydrogenase, mitochondrial n=1 Tax=Capsicum baccatum TaxID=33114 RepID=A0A2G2WDC0_CAPBA|nr:Formate dehydrogenase, mitochondrial [Capsicum baccatum]